MNWPIALFSTIAVCWAASVEDSKVVDFATVTMQAIVLSIDEDISVSCESTSKDPGNNCDAPKPPVNRFYWNDTTASCRAFKYYGCGDTTKSFSSITSCYKRCTYSDPIPCGSSSNSRPPLSTSGAMPGSCNGVVCPDGYACSITWPGITSCCNTEGKDEKAQLWKTFCPNNQISHSVGKKFSLKPIIGDSCDTMVCPSGYVCEQLNSYGAKCCELKPPPSCTAPKDTGTCEGRLFKPVQRWRWDTDERKCIGFLFSGCGGNGNNYATIDECMDQCANRIPDPPPCSGPSQSLLKPPIPPPGPPGTNDLPGHPVMPVTNCRHRDALCPPGFVCNMAMFGSRSAPICCDAKHEAWNDQAYANACPNGMKAYEIMMERRGRPYPVLGQTCDDLQCPKDYACTQINSKFARCCATSETEEGVIPKSFDIGSVFMEAPPVTLMVESCREPVDEGYECGEAMPKSYWYYNSDRDTCISFTYKGCGGNGNRYATRDKCRRCIPADGSPCNSNDVPLPIIDTSPTTPSAPASRPYFPNDCFEPGKKCPDGYKCSRAMAGGVCCNSTASGLYDDLYSEVCPDGSQAYQIWNGEYYDMFVGDSCEKHDCPTGFECTQVNHLGAKCCGTSPPASPSDDDEVFAKQCQTPCAEGCYPLYTKMGCPRCHCPDKLIGHPVVLEAHQKSACSKSGPSCPMHCRVSQNFTTKCTVCECDEGDTRVVHPVRFNIGNDVEACLDLRPHVNYKLFDSPEYGQFSAQVRTITKGNRLFSTLDLNRIAPPPPPPPEPSPPAARDAAAAAASVCGMNERMTECSAHCELKCGEDPARKICTMQCSPTKCACLPQYARNNAGACVPIANCDSEVCGENEQMTVCSAHCEKKCGRLDAMCTRQCSPTKCACKPEHARNSKGKCVPTNQCDVCATNEVMTRCTSHCEPKCGNLTPPCSRICTPEACACKTGTARNAAGKCVPVDQCPSVRAQRDTNDQQCGDNEEMTECSAHCEQKCARLTNICNTMCSPTKCACKQGYARNDQNKCVLIAQCTPPACGVNERWDTCSSHCEKKCGNLNLPCTRNCVPAACACEPGHARNAGGSCVPVDQCDAGASGGVVSARTSPVQTEARYKLHKKLIPGCPCKDFEQDIVLTDLLQPTTWGLTGGDIGRAQILLDGVSMESKEPGVVSMRLSDGRKIPVKKRNRFDISTDTPYQCWSFERDAMFNSETED